MTTWNTEWTTHALKYMNYIEGSKSALYKQIVFLNSSVANLS